MTTSVVESQTDFSAGEIDVTNKRDDDSPVLKAGARQMRNWRILNTKKPTNRSGRRALFLDGPRVEEVVMSATATYYLVFGNASLKVRDSNGLVVFTDSARPWSTATAKDVVWATYRNSIYIAFAGMVPRILTWDGASTWSAANFAESVFNGQKRTAFYRFAAPGITILPSAASGAITLTASQAYFTASHVGTRIRWANRQILITGYTDSTHVSATVQETLYYTAEITFGSDPAAVFQIGDIISNLDPALTSTAIVLSFPGANKLRCQQLAGGYIGVLPGSPTIIGPHGSLDATAGTNISPIACQVWDEEVINSYRGYPASVFVDQNRLGFCNFPGVPSGIAWSATGDFTDFYPDALPTSSIFELAPRNSQVLYVVPGMDGSEFVFCNNKLYYIPITVANPLKPGSVQFSTISEDECGQVQPRRAGEFIIYANAGLNQLMAIRIYGAYSRAYKTDGLTELAAHLFADVVSIAIMTASASFAERYVMVLNADGTLVCGKYSLSKNNELEGMIGWAPWDGVGLMTYVSCRGSNILFSGTYAPDGISPVTLTEILDDDQYLDATINVNNPTTGLQATIAAGTNYGTMTADGGLAAAFDGTRSHAKAASASRAAAQGYVGRVFTVAQVVGQALVWPSTDSGFVIGGAGDITIDLYVKASLPASGTDGTLLATVTLTADQFTGPVVITAPYSTATWGWAHVRINQAGATNVIAAQVIFQTGPLWWLAGGTVDLIDQSTRAMGTYVVDSAGNIVPQGLGGEDLTLASLVAGQPWTATLEPFIPSAKEGQDVGQRMRARRIKRAQTNVYQSTGFVMQRLYSGQSGSQLPDNGDVMSERRIATWNQDDDPTMPPPQREQSYIDRPVGRSHDPRWQISKDTAGPLTILELGFEVTI